MRQSTATSSVVCCHSQLCNMKTTTRPLPVVVTTETTTKSTTETTTRPLPVVVTTETTTERTTATSLATKKNTIVILASRYSKYRFTCLHDVYL